MDYKNKIYYAIFGVAVGDALGLPMQFSERSELEERPVTGMIGYETFEMPPGTWSDDTSLTLALMDGMVRGEGRLDYALIMNNFRKWLWRGAFTPDGEAFDVGGTCLMAIAGYDGTNDPLACGLTEDDSCGNGALMRIMPALFWMWRYYGEDFIENDQARQEIYNLTRLTHGHERCLMANLIYLSVGAELLKGSDKKTAISEGINRAFGVLAKESRFAPYMADFQPLKQLNIFDPEIRPLIKSSGYVVDSIIASMWAFASTDSYTSCTLAAVNLGGDTDTIAAIAGGLAGLYYGIDGDRGIQPSWMAELRGQDDIGSLCRALANMLEE